MKYKTIKEATEAWVREMNAIPQGMILRLSCNDPEDWEEVTTPSKYDRVHVFDDDDTHGEITDIGEKTEEYIIALDNGNQVRCAEGDFEVEHYDYLPMWGMMWSFGDSVDDWWLEKHNGIKLMSECGFRIYKSQEFGYFFGIDGGGYDFYEAHWIPLYKARGLQWHETETEG